MPAYPALLDPTIDNYKVMRESINSIITKLETVESSGVTPHTQAFNTITGTPTTLSGYGITDGIQSGQIDADADFATGSGFIPIEHINIGTIAGTVAAGDHSHPYNTVIGTNTDIVAAGVNDGTVIDSVNFSDGVVVGYTTRVLDAADVGAAASVHTHTLSEITDYAAQAINDTIITIGGVNGLTGGSTFSTNTATPTTINISHATSAAASVNNSGATVIQDITLDSYGHITAIGSKTLTSTDISALALSGGTLTGNLIGTTATFSGEITALSFNATSDMRLKTNYGPWLYKDASPVEYINAVKYVFNDDPTGKIRIGYYAQDVENIIPDAVTTDDTGFKSLDYIQVLVAKVARLEQIIAKNGLS